jgi:hypothetical protein
MRTRKFKRNHLLDHDLDKRLQQIENLSIIANWVPQTTFSIASDILIQYQERISISKEMPSFDHVCKLAAQMDEDLYLVHGDLCRKNLIFDGKQLWVVDWEPSLYQIKYGVQQLMATEPYLAIEDRKRHQLTRRTDVISFFFTVIGFLYPNKILQNKAEWSRVRKTRCVSMTPVSEEIMNQMTFSELVVLAKESKNWIPRLISGIED